MKFTAKLLSVILVISMVFGTVAFAADFSDVSKDNAYYEPIYILSAFGIINGYEDGTFGPEKDVTRAEFATMLMRAMASAGVGSSDPAGTPFTDLGEASWAISDIRTAYDLGIINGMTLTTFEPNSNVTYEQALKMIVCALNYGPSAQSIQENAVNQPWYYGYMQIATSLKLTDRISVAYEKPAKRWEIAQMIYNSFDVKMLEKLELSSGAGAMYQESSSTLLKDKLGITKGRGELIADESNTLDKNGATARDGYILVQNTASNEVYTVAKKDISVAGMLGKVIDYYYKEDSMKEKYLVCVLNKNGSNTFVKINESDVDSVAGSYSDGYTISYYPSADANKPVNVKVAAKPTISVNGKIVTNVAASKLIPETGTIELISSDGGEYNKINIESYDTYVVKSVNSTDKYIVDMYRTTASAISNTLSLDVNSVDYDIKMTSTSGSDVSLSGISQYHVLSVKDGTGIGDKIIRNVIVSTKNVTGSIDEIDLSENIIKIAGSEYKISRYLQNMSKESSAAATSLSSLSAGDTCKAYLDKDGAISYIAKTSSTSSIYGYIVEAAKESKSVKFAILSDKSKTVGSPYFYAADKVRIDGVSYSSSDAILSALIEGGKIITDSGKSKYAQLVKFSVNSSNQINSIETAYINPETEDAGDETLFKYFSVNKNVGKMRFKYSSQDFIGATNSDKFRINSSTKVFVVPQDRTDFSSYGIKTSSYFKDETKYEVEPYDVTGSLNIAGAVVVYSTTETEAKIDYASHMFLITAISQTTNADGVACDKVTGYDVSTAGTVTTKTVYTSDAGVIRDNYSIGDVIVYALNNKGEVNSSTIKLMFSPTNYAAGFSHFDNTMANT
ncbi:MAG: S-layer homology domain-containing protein, partial [Clostridia bacterium]|nr:S-layer homology domain-containing protein [Clostridia bacterium]